LAYIQTGIALGKRDILDPVEVDYLRVANVQDGRLDLSEIKKIIVSRKDISRYAVRTHDVLMTEGGDFDKLGRGFVWEGQLGECLHQNHIFVVRPDKKLLNPYFLSYQAGSIHGKNYFLACSKQSTNLASINSSQLKEFPVLLPNLLEQEKIVSIIKKWDFAIDLTGKLLAEKKQLRSGLMQQLLTGKRRFPGFGRHVAGRKLPHDWSLVPLSELFKPVRRKNSKGIGRVLTASGAHGLVDQSTYFNRSVAGESLAGYYHLVRGEFAYNRSAMNGYPYGAVKRLDDHEEGVLSTLYICFVPNSEKCNSDFYLHLFESGALNRSLREVVQVGARAHGLLNVTLHDFFAIKVPCPPIKEQERIASLLNHADHEIRLFETQADALREQKKGLMQQLLTGKKRIQMAEAAGR